MKYDFDRVFDREGTNSAKWDSRKEVFGRDDILPMWVADSDWPTAKPIIEAIKNRADHGIFGYTRTGDKCNQIVIDWMKRRFGWDIKPDWIVYTNGIVPSISIAIRALTQPGDEVILQPPVYYPFFPAVANSGVQIANNQLHFDGKTYQIDLTDLANKFKAGKSYVSKSPRAKLIVLCSPHNPVGRVWSKEELLRIGEICTENDAIIVSDEIHADLIFEGNKHIPFSSLSEQLAQNSITMMAPSKTFNIPGLHASIIIIPNPKIRKLFNDAKGRLLNEGGIFGQVALKAAYRDCDDWVEDQLVYLQGNMEFTLRYFHQNIPLIKVIEPEGTYLLWLDCRDLNLDSKKLDDFMVNDARVGLDNGAWFGPGGEGFMRLNIACPRSLLEEGLNRIEKAVQKRFGRKTPKKG